MDYKAEYERITGRKWEWDNAYEPANLTQEELVQYLAALFGSGTITSPSENTRQWVW